MSSSPPAAMPVGCSPQTPMASSPEDSVISSYVAYDEHPGDEPDEPDEWATVHRGGSQRLARERATGSRGGVVLLECGRSAAPYPTTMERRKRFALRTRLVPSRGVLPCVRVG